MSGFSFYRGTLPFKRLSPHATAPRKAYPEDGAFDLFADQPGLVGRSATVITTGIAVAIPPGFVGQLWGRSKLSSRGVNPMGFIFLEEDGTLRLGGMIDSGYRGPLLILLAAVGPESKPHEIKRGDAAAQLCILPIPDLEPFDVGEDALPPAVRGFHGFGSSDPIPPEVVTPAIDEESIRRMLNRDHARLAVLRGHAGLPLPPVEDRGITMPYVQHAAPAPREGSGRITSRYSESAPLPPRQESPPPRGSAHYTLAERMDQSIPDYPQGAAPYHAPPAPTSPVAPSPAPGPSDPPAETTGPPTGLLDALARWGMGTGGNPFRSDPG